MMMKPHEDTQNYGNSYNNPLEQKEKNIDGLGRKSETMIKKNRNKSIIKILSIIAIVVVLLMSNLLTYFFTNKNNVQVDVPQSKPNTTTTLTVEDLFPYMTDSLYYTNSSGCTGTNIEWNYGECKTNFTTMWSIGAPGVNKYLIVRFYSDNNCSTLINNTYVMLSSGCLNTEQIYNRLHVNYVSAKFCKSTDIC